MIRPALRAVVVAATIATAAVAVAEPATAAPTVPAAPPGSISVTYAVTGSTHVAKSGIDVAFKRTAIVNTLLPSGTLRSTLPLAPVKVSYLAYGFLPAKATVVFTQVQPATGTLTPSDEGLQVSATAQYVVSLRDVSFGGAAANVGASCQTTRPVTVTVATPAGDSFDISNGGTLSGTYSIGKFQNCGKGLDLINDLVPGPGNTLTLQLSNGVING